MSPILLEPNLPPVLLSPTIAIVQWGIITLLSFGMGWQFYTRKTKMGQDDEIKRLNTALDAATSAQSSMSVELDLTKTNLERSRTESTKKSEEIGRLMLATDLKPLFSALHEMAETQQQYFKEGRERFTKAEEDLKRNHSEQAEAWLAVFQELKAQREEALEVRRAQQEAYSLMSAAFQTHVLDDKKDQLDRRAHDVRFLNLIDSIERRFQDVGVRLGVIKWSTPESGPEFDQRIQLSSGAEQQHRRSARGK